MTSALDFFRSNSRGIGLAIVIAATAQFLSEHYGGPAMLFALLIGMAFNFLAHEPETKPGLTLASKTILRIGVALLGLRIFFADIAGLGFDRVLAIVAFVALTVIAGIVIAKACSRDWHYGALTGGAVAICGASAALALAAILPRKTISEQDTLLTVVSVTALSTIAMIIYPALFSALGLDAIDAGFLVGATIHDVAQVVGAGYSISAEAGDFATLVKLMRVAMLPVVLIVLSIFLRREGSLEGKGNITLPWFLVVFIVLMLLNNLASLPVVLTDALSFASRAFLLIAVAALGVKTSLGELRQVGRTKFFIVVGETLFLLLIALAYILATR